MATATMPTIAIPITSKATSRPEMPARMASDLLIQEHSLHPNNPYLFPSPATGTMYSPETVARIHKRLLKDAGLEDCRFHDLRHTFATRCVESGFEIKSLSEILGHASVNITLNRYVHSSLELKKKNMKKMDAYLRSL